MGRSDLPAASSREWQRPAKPPMVMGLGFRCWVEGLPLPHIARFIPCILFIDLMANRLNSDAKSMGHPTPGRIFCDMAWKAFSQTPCHGREGIQNAMFVRRHGPGVTELTTTRMEPIRACFCVVA